MAAVSSALLALSEPQPITFAQNLTEATFQNHDDDLDDDMEPELLFPPAEEEDSENPGAKRGGASKRRNRDHIPRPPNAFILFRSHFIKSQHIPGTIEGNHSQLSKIVGACWQRLSYEEKSHWEKRAKVARAEHKRKYPDYRFVRGARNSKSSIKDKPPAKFVNTIAVSSGPPGENGAEPQFTTMVSPPANKSRRRTAAKATDDPLRCEQIARLLVAGHKGQELEAIVQQLDAEAARKKENEPEAIPQPAQPFPERIAHPSLLRAQAIRRTSSCPPLDIQSAVNASREDFKTSQAPSRRQKTVRNTTMPYPTTTVKQARSVSPCITPNQKDVFDLTAMPSPVEGVFANQHFSFAALTMASPTSVDGISPHDTSYYEVTSPLSAVSQGSFIWTPTDSSPSVAPNYSAYQSSLEVPRAFAMQPSLSTSSSCSDLSAYSHMGKDSVSVWSSDFDNWIPSTDDERATSSAPPATPDGNSPCMPYSELTPSKPLIVTTPYPDVEAIQKPTLDLNNYAKGLAFFNQTTPFYCGVQTPEPEYYATNPELTTAVSAYDMPLAHVSPINAGAPWQYQQYNY